MNIVIVGEAKIGKTALVTRFREDHFSAAYQATIVSETNIKKLDGEADAEGHPLQMQIIDTGGSKNYQDLISQPVKTADVVIICADLTTPLEGLPAKIQMIKDLPHLSNLQIIVVGTKEDLLYTSVNLRKSVKGDTILVYQVSARTGKGVKELFADIEARYKERAKKTLPTKEVLTAFYASKAGLFSLTRVRLAVGFHSPGEVVTLLRAHAKKNVAGASAETLAQFNLSCNL